MISLAKLTEFQHQIPNKQHRDLSHITDEASFHVHLANSSYEKNIGSSISNAATLSSKKSIHVRRVPTVAEYKAIINSQQCPLEEILVKAPEILRTETKKLIASLPLPKKSMATFHEAHVKKLPSEYRRKTCLGCKSLLDKMNQAQEAKPKYKPMLKKKSLKPKTSISTKSNNSKKMSEMFRFDEDEYRRQHGIKPALITSAEKQGANPEIDDDGNDEFSRLAWNIFDDLSKLNQQQSQNLVVSGKSGVNTRGESIGSVNSAFGFGATALPATMFAYLLAETQNLTGSTSTSTSATSIFEKGREKASQKKSTQKVKKPMEKPGPNKYSNPKESRSKSKHRYSHSNDSEHVFVINGLPVAVKGYRFHNFTHWFGDEKMLNRNSKKAEFDAHGFTDDKIEIKLYDRNKLDITGIHTSHFSGNLQRKKFIGTFIIPKPDVLYQYQFCRNTKGVIIIEKRPLVGVGVGPVVKELIQTRAPEFVSVLKKDKPKNMPSIDSAASAVDKSLTSPPSVSASTMVSVSALPFKVDLELDPNLLGSKSPLPKKQINVVLTGRNSAVSALPIIDVNESTGPISSPIYPLSISSLQQFLNEYSKTSSKPSKRRN